MCWYVFFCEATFDYRIGENLSFAEFNELHELKKKVRGKKVTLSIWRAE